MKGSLVFAESTRIYWSDAQWTPEELHVEARFGVGYVIESSYPTLLTFPARSSLDKNHRRPLLLHRHVADALQLADVPVGDPVAAAHRLGAGAHAHPGRASPPHGGGHLHAVSHQALQPFGALPVIGAAALLPIAGPARRAAVAAVQRVTGQTVCRDRSALRLVTLFRTADGDTLDYPRLGRQQDRCA